MTAYRDSNPAGDPHIIDGLDDHVAGLGPDRQDQMLPAGAAQRHRHVAAHPRHRDRCRWWRQLYDDVDTLNAAETADAARNAAAARDGYRSRRTRSIVLLTWGSPSRWSLGLLVARGIVRPLARVKAVCEGLATGRPHPHHRPGHPRRARPDGPRAGHRDRPRLRQTVTTIDGSAASLAGASEQLTGVSTRSPPSRGGDLGAGAGRVRRRRGGLPQRRHRLGRQRGDGRVDPGDRPERHRGGPGRRPRRSTVTATTSATMSKLGESSAEIGNVVKVITVDRRADQPARAQRDHRGRPGRRGRQGLRRRRLRGQGPGPGDRPGHRGHLPPGRGHPGRHHRRGRRDRADLRRSSPGSTTSRPRSPPRSRSRPPPPPR